MGVFDIIVLALIAIALVAVVRRVRKKGTCGDCAQGGSCDHAKHSSGSCPAMKGVDKVADELGRGVH